jgi:hypothetical protein
VLVVVVVAVLPESLVELFELSLLESAVRTELSELSELSLLATEMSLFEPLVELSVLVVVIELSELSVLVVVIELSELSVLVVVIELSELSVLVFVTELSELSVLVTELSELSVLVSLPESATLMVRVRVELSELSVITELSELSVDVVVFVTVLPESLVELLLFAVPPFAAAPAPSAEMVSGASWAITAPALSRTARETLARSFDFMGGEPLRSRGERCFTEHRDRSAPAH